jgi:tetratricopeptide (TPR) repeat protein
MQKAASTPLPCAEHKLSRFAQEQPGNALANYYYGMSLWKRDRRSGDPAGIREAEKLLETALTIDPKLDDGYVQLGILYSERGEFEKAIRTYKKALEANPDLGDAHYRLGLAYKRIGRETEAQQEFQLYEQGQKAETAAFERERRELRQFLVTLKDQRETPSPQ